MKPHVEVDFPNTEWLFQSASSNPGPGDVDVEMEGLDNDRAEHDDPRILSATSLPLTTISTSTATRTPTLSTASTASELAALNLKPRTVLAIAKMRAQIRAEIKRRNFLVGTKHCVPKRRAPHHLEFRSIPAKKLDKDSRSHAAPPPTIAIGAATVLNNNVAAPGKIPGSGPNCWCCTSFICKKFSSYALKAQDGAGKTDGPTLSISQDSHTISTNFGRSGTSTSNGTYGHPHSSHQKHGEVQKHTTSKPMIDLGVPDPAKTQFPVFTAAMQEEFERQFQAKIDAELELNEYMRQQRIRSYSQNYPHSPARLRQNPFLENFYPFDPPRTYSPTTPPRLSSPSRPRPSAPKYYVPPKTTPRRRKEPKLLLPGGMQLSPFDLPHERRQHFLDICFTQYSPDPKERLEQAMKKSDAEWEELKRTNAKNQKQGQEELNDEESDESDIELESDAGDALVEVRGING